MALLTFRAEQFFVVGECPVHRRMPNSIPDLYPLDQSSIPQSRCLKMSPDILPPRGKTALSWAPLVRIKILNILPNINTYKVMYLALWVVLENRTEDKTTWPHLGLRWVNPLKANILGKGLWENSSRENWNSQKDILKIRMATQTKGSWNKATST